jgi:hypothetical protein
MKKAVIVLLLWLLAAGFSRAENFSLYAGKTSVKTNFWGISLGGNIWTFLQLQVDVFKYFSQDLALYSPIKAENRGDFTAVSGNIVLKIPIHLLPYLHDFEFVQPYVLRGYGAGLENLSSEYWDVPNIDGKPGILTKIRRFDTLGAGIVIMVTRKLGVKADFRSINIIELKGMAYPARRFSRFSFGICF